MINQNDNRLLQIGEIAQKAGATVRTVRYYLDEGFIEAAGRSPGGFYLFTPDAANTVFWVQKLKDAGLALKDIKSIYLARRRGFTGHEASRQVLRHLEQQKAIIEQKIADYQALKIEMEDAIEMAAECEGCGRKPSRNNCATCSKMTSRKKIPLPVKAIL